MKIFTLVSVLLLTLTLSQQSFSQSNKEITEDSTIYGNIPFQGYNETTPITTKLQYRIFYQSLLLFLMVLTH